MDEPFGAVDEITRGQLQEEILRIHRESGITILFVTHDIAEALKLGTRTLVIDKGTVQQCAQPEELLRHPATDFVRELVEPQRRRDSILQRRRLPRCGAQIRTCSGSRQHGKSVDIRGDVHAFPLPGVRYLSYRRTARRVMLPPGGTAALKAICSSKMPAISSRSCAARTAAGRTKSGSRTPRVRGWAVKKLPFHSPSKRDCHPHIHQPGS